MSEHPRAFDFLRRFKAAGFSQIHGASGFADIVFGRAAATTTAAMVARFYSRFVLTFFVARKRLSARAGHQAEIGRTDDASCGGLAGGAMGRQIAVFQTAEGVKRSAFGTVKIVEWHK